MQDSAKSNDPGFRLPKDSAPPPAAPQQLQVVSAAPPPAADTSVRDTAIGGAVFLALLAAYFFVRGSYVHHLVVKRVAPATASSAGWLLFVGLAFVSGAGILAAINAARYLTWTAAGPLVLTGLLALAGALWTGRR